MLLCLDSQNKERRKQETHYYASEVGISVVPARFRHISAVSVTGRYDPIWPDYGRISLVRRKSQKKNCSDAAPMCGQPRRTPLPRQAVSDLGTAPSQPRPCFLDCNKQRIQTIESTIMIICKMIKTGSLIKNV